MKITLNDIKYMVNESVRRIIKEGKPFDDGYDAYVLVDESDGAILANYAKDKSDPTYDPYEDAINDANQKKTENKFGSYCVYGCIEDVYDDDTLVYKTD